MHKRPPASIEVSRLDYRYPGSERPALSEVGFRIAPGEKVGLLGPNGAGKSTLMRILCGYLPPQASLEEAGGGVRVAGLDVREHSLEVRQQVGYLPELVPLYMELRVREHLDFRASIKGVARKERAAECRRVAEATGLLDMFDTPIGRLSRGYRQRVGIADALLGAPPLVVLDEPTVGLDPNQIQAIRAMLGALGGEQTLLFSSHVLAEVEQLCDRILILSRGHLVADESVRDAVSGGVIVELLCSVGMARQIVGRALGELGVRDVDADLSFEDFGGRVRVVVPGKLLTAPSAEASGAGWGAREEQLASSLGQAALAEGVAVVRMESGRRRLEERFARATGFGDEFSPSGPDGGPAPSGELKVTVSQSVRLMDTPPAKGGEGD